MNTTYQSDTYLLEKVYSNDILAASKDTFVNIFTLSLGNSGYANVEYDLLLFNSSGSQGHISGKFSCKTSSGTATKKTDENFIQSCDSDFAGSLINYNLSVSQALSIELKTIYNGTTSVKGWMRVLKN